MSLHLDQINAQVKFFQVVHIRLKRCCSIAFDSKICRTFAEEIDPLGDMNGRSLSKNSDWFENYGSREDLRRTALNINYYQLFFIT